jgi:hypothetical protein
MVSPIQRNESLQASHNNQPARRNPQGTAAAAQQVSSQLVAQLPSAGGNSATRVRPAEAQETQDSTRASKRQRLHHEVSNTDQVEEIPNLLQLPKEVIQGVFTFLGPNSRDQLVLVNKELKTLVREQQRAVRAPANELNQALVAFPNVAQIKFTRAPSVEEIEGIHDSQRIGQIKHLDLSSFNTLTDEALVALVSKFPNVTSVDLSGGARLSDAGLNAISQGWPNLTSLNTSGGNLLTDVSIVALAQGCPNLTHLNLLGQNRLSNVGVIALAEGCPRLASLNIDFCERISDEAVIALARRCPNLTRVCLTDSLVTDAAVEALAAGCPNLSELFLQGCEGVTDAVFYMLADRYTNFQVLAVGNEDQDVSDEAIEAFERRNPNVDLILEFF